jgi:hypothetical protein
VAWPRGGTPLDAPGAGDDAVARCDTAAVVVVVVVVVVVDGSGGVVVVGGTGDAVVVVEDTGAVAVGGAVAGGVVVAVADGLVVDAMCTAKSVTPAAKTSVAGAPKARHRRVGEEGMGELPPGGTRRGNTN